MRLVRDVGTAELQVGDAVEWRGEFCLVVECVDTGRPAAFGSGSAYDLTLNIANGAKVPMRAAASQRWTRR